MQRPRVELLFAHREHERHVAGTSRDDVDVRDPVVLRDVRYRAAGVVVHATVHVRVVQRLGGRVDGARRRRGWDTV